jgi:glycosyltransferase involved in cell wall biosynthesis
VNQPLFSLILATLGRVDEIYRLLASLQAQTCDEFELIVVDQNRDDRITPLIEKAMEGGLCVRYIRQDLANLSAARNAGLEVAQGYWIAVPDDDCWYEPEVLANIRDRIKTLPHVDGLIAQWVERANSIKPDGDSPLVLARCLQFKDGDASSIVMFLRTEFVREAGGFDTLLGVGQWYGAGEETDLLIRVLRRGAVIERFPQAKVHHAYINKKRTYSAADFQSARSRARGWGAVCAKNNVPLLSLLKGLVGPLTWPIARARSFSGLLQSAAVVIGRWEGYLSWLRKHRWQSR